MVRNHQQREKTHVNVILTCQEEFKHQLREKTHVNVILTCHEEFTLTSKSHTSCLTMDVMSNTTMAEEYDGDHINDVKNLPYLLIVFSDGSIRNRTSTQSLNFVNLYLTNSPV